MDVPRSSSLTRLRKETLKRVLGVFDLFAIGYGDLGSSIFYALGVTAFFSLGATPISLCLAGLVFICTALSYAEMCSMFHESGGSASFARRAFNDFISFIAGWGLLLDYIVTIAISSFAVGPYLSYFFPEFTHPGTQISFSISLMGLLFLVNVYGVKQSTRISVILTMVVLLVEAAVIALGSYYLLDLGYLLSQMKIGDPSIANSPTWTQFFQGTAMAMVAYTGIESIAQLGAESQTPARIVPRAIIVTMGVLIAAYLGVSLVSLSAVSPHDLGTIYVANPFSAVIQALPIGSSILAPAGALIAAAILTVSANAGLIGASRLSFNMGEYYQLPQFFHSVNRRFRTPTLALGFFAVIAALIVIASRGRIAFLADLYNFGAMLAFFSAHLSLIVLRVKHPDMKRPFKIRGNLRFKGKEIPITALIGALATLSVWFLVIITKPEGRYLGFAWMIFGISMYLIYRKSHWIKTGGSLRIHRLQVPGYTHLTVTKILLPIAENTLIETVQMAASLAQNYRAPVTILYVLDIPASIPLDSKMPRRDLHAQQMLKVAEAVMREYGVQIHCELVRSRSFSRSVLKRIASSRSDLLILGPLASKKDTGSLDRIIKIAPCRVLVSTGINKNLTLQSALGAALG